MTDDDGHVVTPTLWYHPSPVGELLIEVTEDGVRSLRFPNEAEARPAHLDVTTHGVPDPVTASALDQYFAGDPEALNALPVDLGLVRGLRHRQVLEVLRARTRFGETVTYGTLAEWSGVPGAAQLIGQIMGANPLPIIIPCHRVVAADGSLGGFSGGLDTKRALFRIEGIMPRAGGWGHPGYDQPELF